MSFRQDVLNKISQKQDLPSLPDLVVKLSRMVADGETSASDISKVVQYDPALAGRILKVANSAAFGGSSRVASIPQAVMRIGFTRLRDLVLSLSMMQAFKGKNLRLDFVRFWRHSLSTAFAAQVIERKAARADTPSDEMFSAGLLHDLGAMVLDLFAADQYNKVVEFAHRENKELCAAEQEILGIDHAEAGAHLLEIWNLPSAVIESARYHHDPYPENQPTLLLTKIVHLANFACNNQGIDNGVGTFPTTFSSSAWYDTGLSVDDIPAIISDVNRLTAEADEIIAAAK